jgi:hypothetical protein
MKLDARAKLTLIAIQRALRRPETKYKLIANAFAFKWGILDCSTYFHSRE